MTYYFISAVMLSVYFKKSYLYFDCENLVIHILANLVKVSLHLAKNFIMVNTVCISENSLI